jgi:hypothetical protein
MIDSTSSQPPRISFIATIVRPRPTHALHRERRDSEPEREPDGRPVFEHAERTEHYGRQG